MRWSRDTYIEIVLARVPLLEKYDRFVPAMPVRTASHNPAAAGQPTKGWEHRSRASGWLTRTVAVARNVGVKELARTPNVRDNMQY